VTGSYQREGFAGAASSQEVEKAAQGGVAWVAATLDPMHSDTDDGAADHGQVQHADGMTHAAAVLPGTDIQAQREAGFKAPVTAVSGEHLLGGEGFCGT